MLTLDNLESEWMLISFNNYTPGEESISELSKCQVLLYNMDYTITTISNIEEGRWSKSFLAYKSTTEEDIKKDIYFLREKLKDSEIIFKLPGRQNIIQITDQGEVDMIIEKNSEPEARKKIWIHSGQSFSFKNDKKWIDIISKDQLEKGMLVEILNGDRWISRRIDDLDLDWEKSLKLFSKYKKLRRALN